MINHQFDSGKALFLCASDFESANKYGFDSKEYKEGTKRLVEFYKKLGFKVIIMDDQDLNSIAGFLKPILRIN